VYLSPEVQKQYDEANASNGYKEILERKLNNTYTSTVTAGGNKPFILVIIHFPDIHWE
jgi:hypothetical protein